jgi:hypothetical protein
MNDAAAEAAEETEECHLCCANCGIAGVDDITLQGCTDCDLVKYCTDRCQENHREQHEEECKNRKALLHDRKLMQQPDETHLGECPLCFLPMPTDSKKYVFYSCCSNDICKGCVYATRKSNINDPMEAMRCPFCREPPAIGKKEINRRLMKRVKANDPAALSHMGGTCFGKDDFGGAYHYHAKAAELGDLHSHYHLGVMYREELGVEKDMEKAVYHWEKAAVGGHPAARHNLGCIEGRNGNMERAVKHWIIAANLGHENSMKTLWKNYSAGNITKEDLDATLRSHQAAIDAMKSEQREEVGKVGTDHLRQMGLIMS